MLAVWTCLALALSACGLIDRGDAGFSDVGWSGAEGVQAAQAAQIDPSTYAGDVQFLLQNTFVTPNGSFPVVLYLGLAAESDTRLRANAFFDLRGLQTRLRQVLTGAVESTCERQIDLDFQGARAEADGVRARGTVQVQLYRCDPLATASDQRGPRRLTQTVDAEAVVTAALRDQCIVFGLKELRVEPRGVLGVFTGVFVATEDTRETLLKKANTILSENPICPDLPGEVVALSPRFISGQAREIGAGGIGAELSGSIDISAQALIGLLAALKERGLLKGQV